LSRQYASHLLFDTRLSNQYLSILFICFLLSLVSILILQLGLTFKILCLILLLFITYKLIKNHISYRLHWRADGSWLVARGNVDTNNVTKNNVAKNNVAKNNVAKNNVSGNIIYNKAILRPGSVVTPYFACLNFVFENKHKENVLIFKDNINSEQFRQLRVRLKVEGIKL